jgi:hypothetical protein
MKIICDLAANVDAELCEIHRPAQHFEGNKSTRIPFLNRILMGMEQISAHFLRVMRVLGCHAQDMYGKLGWREGDHAKTYTDISYLENTLQLKTHSKHGPTVEKEQDRTETDMHTGFAIIPDFLWWTA